MAEEEKQDINEQVRQGARGFFKLLTWIVPIGILVYVLYAMFFVSDRADLDSPDKFLTAYNNEIRPFVPPSLRRPTQYDVNLILEYFDDSSRRYFNERAKYLAAIRLGLQPTVDQKRIEQMGRDEARGEALVYLLSMPPLSGFARIERQEIDEAAGKASLEVLSRGAVYPVTLVKEGGSWAIADLGGKIPFIEEKLETYFPEQDFD